MKRQISAYRHLAIVAVFGAIAFAEAACCLAADPPADASAFRPAPSLIMYSKEEIEAQSQQADEPISAPEGVTPELAYVWHFLASKASDLKLPSDVSNLKLVSSQRSLLGSHYHFQQVLGGIEVDRASIVVSTDKQGRVTSIHNSSVPVTADKVARVSKASINRQAAIDAAWQALGAQVDPNSGIFEEPSARLRYIPDKAGFRLVYSVELYVLRKRGEESEPGLWRVFVDAISGQVIGEPEKLSVDHKQAGDEPYEKRAGDRVEAFRIFEAYKAAKQQEAADETPAEKVAGTGLVFDHDPVSALQNASLRDNSPAGDFETAYKRVTLPDITKRGNAFFLEGPWVRIVNFETPSTSPSSTADGSWTAKRGDNAFNDVMTYYHIDRSQRYIQSLGFQGIQAASIEADSDGLSGADNSHYLPGVNRIAFGHGCIDDNEDADVILHEYGHAITHSINPQWGGGDSGAIGEGFGDYWAETSSVAVATGSAFQLFKTFDWDSADGCWQGRRLDVKPSEATYNPSRTYGAHQDIGNGVQSDELWSTPLYQAHLELRQGGRPREEIDQIVLQSMFGLGANFTMRQAAQRVVQTAQTLFPSGPHAAVFEKHFKELKILP